MLQIKPAWIWHISQTTVTEHPSHETVSFFPVSPFSGTSAPFTLFLLLQMPLCLLPTLPDCCVASQFYFKGLAEPTTALSFLKYIYIFLIYINKPRKPSISELGQETHPRFCPRLKPCPGPQKCVQHWCCSALSGTLNGQPRNFQPPAARVV